MYPDLSLVRISFSSQEMHRDPSLVQTFFSSQSQSRTKVQRWVRCGSVRKLLFMIILYKPFITFVIFISKEISDCSLYTNSSVNTRCILAVKRNILTFITYGIPLYGIKSGWWFTTGRISDRQVYRLLALCIYSFPFSIRILLFL